MPYMIVSNTYVKEICVLQDDGEYCIVCYKDNDAGLNEEISRFRIRRKRIYDTMEEAETHAGNRSLLRKSIKDKIAHRKTHHDYEMEYYEDIIRHGRRRRFGKEERKL